MKKEICFTIIVMCALLSAFTACGGANQPAPQNNVPPTTVAKNNPPAANNTGNKNGPDWWPQTSCRPRAPSG